MKLSLVLFAETISGRTPQGVRGLKPHVKTLPCRPGQSHSARSAWIETVIYPSGEVETISRTPQGVRGLKPHNSPGNVRLPQSHSARSAWIETTSPAAVTDE